jgi:large subunit ribosomal protein L15
MSESASPSRSQVDREGSETALDLSTLKPAQKRKARKRVGRGLGSGKGRYSGRGIKGQKARSGSHTMRAGFEGGQMPIYMRLGKQRGPYSKDAMPIGPHRTRTIGVNLSELMRAFDGGDEVTLEAMVAKGLIKNTRTDVKILGNGDLRKKLTVTAHAFSASAREKIEKAGGTANALREPKAPSRTKRSKRAGRETRKTASQGAAGSVDSSQENETTPGA